MVRGVLTVFFIFTLHLVNKLLLQDMARSIRYFLVLLFTVVAGSAYAQAPGSIQGTVVDETNQPVIGALIEAFQSGIKKGGAVTDENGVYVIKPLSAGRYEVHGSYTSYSRRIFTDVIVSPDRVSSLDFAFQPNTLDVVTIKYVPPMVNKYDGKVTSTITAEDIKHMPTINTGTMIAASSPGIVRGREGDGLNVGGSRTQNAVTYVDGVQVRGNAPNLGQGVIDQIEVQTGGTSAKYGDATGAVINITTRGPSKEFSGNAGLEHSVEGFSHNMATLSLSGPLLSRKIDGEKRPVLGFLVNGEVYYDKNRNPSYIGNWVVKDDVRQRLEDQPLLLAPNAGGIPVYYYSTEFVTKNDLKKVRVMPNAAVFEGRAFAKFDYQLSDNINITLGGNFNYSKGSALAGRNNYNFIMFAPDAIPVTENFSGRAYLRLTQKFARAQRNNTPGEEKEKESIISNAYYTLQGDYQKDYANTEDPNHGRNLFNYGYLGKFTQNTESRFQFDVDTNTGVRMWKLVSYDAPTSFTFDRAEVNPVMANYTSQFYNLGGLPQTIAELRGQRGLANGDFPAGSYGLYPNIGSTLAGYGYSNDDQVSAGANASFDLKLGKTKHSIEFGLYYQQRIERNYSASANLTSTNSIWEVMRNSVNTHISLDAANPYYVINGQTYTIDQVKSGQVIPGNFDTLFYNRMAVDSLQTNFDRNLRAKLGLPLSGTDRINIDGLDPSTFSLNMFSPDELVNSLGNPLVNYSGYDYLGNRLKGQVNFNDYFTEYTIGSNGKRIYSRNIGAFRPNYISGYLLDRFQFKDILFNIGVRVDRYDLNTKVLKDPYSLYEVKTIADVKSENPSFTTPSNMGDNYVVYVDNNASSNPQTIGYRNGDDWYNAQGQLIQDPTILKIISGRDPQPYLVDRNIRITDTNYRPETAFTDYKPQVSLSPRIAFSFPISDVALFYAHYDILVQRPTSNSFATPYDYMYLTQNTGAIGNPNLRPEKTFDYEFGFTQTLSKYSVISIAGTYKERKDQIQLRPYLYAWPQTYYTFGNRDFSTTKGFYLKYDLRRVNRLRMNINYTLQFVEGTGSNSGSSGGGLLQTFVAAQFPNLRYIMPLDYDSRHIINASVDYRFEENDGPMVSGNHILQNAGINLLFTSRSGEPYTRYAQPTRVANTVKGELNGSRKAWHYMLDLRVDKDFSLSLSKKKKNNGEQGSVKPKRQLYVNAYCYITNVLNTRDILAVDGFTGRPDDDGYLVSAKGQLDVQTRTNPIAFTDQYTVSINNPYNINLPRRINFGLNFNF